MPEQIQLHSLSLANRAAFAGGIWPQPETPGVGLATICARPPDASLGTAG